MRKRAAAVVLDQIIEGVQEDLAVRQGQVPLDDLKAQAASRPPAKDLLARLSAANSVGVIAEVKRSSPSRGAIAAIADPAALAQAYEAGGAAAISVLTERRFFGGSLADLKAVRRAVDVPVLRKDFVVSSYQVWEARAYGADIVLLIVAALERLRLIGLIERTVSLGMTPLVEVHSEAELEVAIECGAKLIGFNARDLKTLAVDPAVFGRLAPLAGPGIVKVAESGVSGPHDLAAYAHRGADAVLIGEYVATASDPEQAVRELVAMGSHPSVRSLRR
ncbi:MAG: indole-3-glycerol phosphate synthase TrpC [Bifidobacteriaceae bacterium]|jgi:indole-3-glycerol phosphate synthase|nr:indole-3-glycerol phosphate synthase TrpC [Bifidobacteriaceae bacterium]